MAKRFGWFDDWRDKKYRCKCGWSGRVGVADLEGYAELGDFCCPQCDTMIFFVSYPTLPDIRAAAAAGNKDALEQLELIERSAK